MGKLRHGDATKLAQGCSSKSAGEVGLEARCPDSPAHSLSPQHRAVCLVPEARAKLHRLQRGERGRGLQPVRRGDAVPGNAMSQPPWGSPGMGSEKVQGPPSYGPVAFQAEISLEA